MSSQILPPTTAALDPKRFPETLYFLKSKRWPVILLLIFLFAGFILRVHNLGAESLGEDELNKLQTVQEYRTNGLTGKNGEHPFLMKGLQTLSIAGAERLNKWIPNARISDEAALRFPICLFGTLTGLLIFLLISELFGRSLGLVSAALWSVEPAAIGFDRIAKEDSLVLFFFLLTNLLWVRSQTAAERGEKNWVLLAWGAGVGFAGLMASKYYPHLLAIGGAYYNVFKHIPGKLWNLEAKRWIIFFLVMGLAFLILNPTILLPETWREMLKFSGENRIGHDSYEFIGTLYRNQMTAWLSGVPWTFYYVFILVKTSTITLLLALIGIPLLFRRGMGDGRYFLFFWAFMWFLPFTFLGGKFTRYFTFVEPLIFVAAAAAFCSSMGWMLSVRRIGEKTAAILQLVLMSGFLAFPLFNSLAVTPHFRLFTNSLGSTMRQPGSFFPHDEFYDAGTREIVDHISSEAVDGAQVACETPDLFEYYARKRGRNDLHFVSLSDESKVAGLRADDFIVVAAGRRYVSNSGYIDMLKGTGSPVETIDLGGVPAVWIYKLDETTRLRIQEIARQASRN
ncbi:MAG: phospholipid carrier-dependent glycosyltransferase [Pyrinomonadaceae bacterium]